MSADFVNKLVSYYDLGCNCLGYTNGVAGLSGQNNNNNNNPSPTNIPSSFLNINGINPINFAGYPIYNSLPHKGILSKKQNNTNIKIIDNIVQLPGL